MLNILGQLTAVSSGLAAGSPRRSPVSRKSIRRPAPEILSEMEAKLREWLHSDHLDGCDSLRGACLEVLNRVNDFLGPYVAEASEGVREFLRMVREAAPGEDGAGGEDLGWGAQEFPAARRGRPEGHPPPPARSPPRPQGPDPSGPPSRTKGPYRAPARSQTPNLSPCPPVNDRGALTAGRRRQVAGVRSPRERVEFIFC